MSLICIKPFLSLEINNEGNVYTCCPSYINEHKIGNIFKEDTTSLEDIWYSKEAEKIREKKGSVPGWKKSGNAQKKNIATTLKKCSVKYWKKTI